MFMKYVEQYRFVGIYQMGGIWCIKWIRFLSLDYAKNSRNWQKKYSQYFIRENLLNGKVISVSYTSNISYSSLVIDRYMALEIRDFFSIKLFLGFKNVLLKVLH